jgi:hypothetical protein
MRPQANNRNILRSAQNGIEKIDIQFGKNKRRAKSCSRAAFAKSREIYPAFVSAM